jgi:NAD(P)-dependent dehydrogenase (short-subunit alcohol dehydrogenase family)
MTLHGLEGKAAFVTGAARAPGMGRATALRLAEEGADVVCVDSPATGNRDLDSDAVAPGELDALVTEIKAKGRRAIAIEANTTDEASIDPAVASAVEAFGRIDVCCHLGGGTGTRLGTGPLVEIDEHSWDQCMATNLIGPWLVARACAAQMVKQGSGGAITLLSSYAARNTPEGFGAFSSARVGVVRLVEVMATELAPANIRVNTVLPLGVEPSQAPNPGLSRLLDDRGQSKDAWVQQNIPLGRLQAADETAAVFAFLSSDDASFVSGQAINVSGGAVR